MIKTRRHSEKQEKKTAIVFFFLNFENNRDRQICNTKWQTGGFKKEDKVKIEKGLKKETSPFLSL